MNGSVHLLIHNKTIHIVKCTLPLLFYKLYHFKAYYIENFVESTVWDAISNKLKLEKIDIAHSSITSHQWNSSEQNAFLWSMQQYNDKSRLNETSTLPF